MRTTAAGWVRTIGLVAQGLGIDPQALFAEASLEYSHTQNAYLRVPQDAITRLWQLLVTRSGDPAIGLQFGRYVTPVTFGAVGYVLLSCATVIDSLRQVIHYQRFLGEGLRCELHERGDQIELHFAGLGDQQQVTSQTMEAKLSAFFYFASWVIRAPVVPVRVCLQHPFNAPVDTYHQLFGCAIEDQARFTGFVLPSTFMHQALPTHDPVLLQQQLTLADDMQSRAFQPLSLQVRQLLRDWLPVGRILQEQVAAALHVTTKTLQRRLKDEGLSFSRLLEDCRHEAACAYLAQPNVELVEVAELAAYADYSAFAKAFKRRTGNTPLEWRQAQPLSRRTPDI